MVFFRIGLILNIIIFLVSCIDQTSNDQIVKDGDTRSKQYKIVWHWIDDFSVEHQEKIKDWLREITLVTRQTIGVYQFDVHYYLHKSKGGKEPVPYAHTSRKKNKQAVHFYVNPLFSKEAFLSDWTAQHEISHLSMPFVGKKNMWFSEGYATYLSRKIMVNQGYYTEFEFDSIYFHRIAGDRYIFEHGEISVPALCEKLKLSHHYPSIYYAGCSYFYLINKKLQEVYDIELKDVVAKYQTQNRLIDSELKDVIKSFDWIIGEPIFSDLYLDYLNKPSREVLSYFKT